MTPRPAAPQAAQAHRTIVRAARFLPAEWVAVKRRAAEAGKPPATFLREAALSAQIIQALAREPSRADRAVYELARIGNNLNQLARAANASGRFAIEEQVQAVLDDILTLIGELR
jgi:hypothetical protein